MQLHFEALDIGERTAHVEEDLRCEHVRVLGDLAAQVEAPGYNEHVRLE